MKGIIKYLVLATVFIHFNSINISGFSLFNPAEGLEGYAVKDIEQVNQPNQEDTFEIKYPVQPYSPFPYGGLEEPRGLTLKNPPNIRSSVVYDPETGEYVVRQSIGSIEYKPQSSYSVSEYIEQDTENMVRDYWRQRSSGENLETQQSFIPSFQVGGEAFDRVFGTSTINIVPQGSAELVFGFNISRVDNPTLTERLRRTPSFNFEERIQMNVTGTIGDKMELGINYNTEATFDFENKTKLEYTGDEDEIIKKIEAGNVTLPLTGSLITGSQSLFGIKTEMQFGKLTVTNVFSQQKGETSVIDVQGGAQLNDFEITADDYEANKHFFLSHYFKENYDNALRNLPIINSGVTITKIEVWVTNKSGNFENSRNIMAFLDLAENNNANLLSSGIFQVAPGQNLPSNSSNDLYNRMTTEFTIRNVNNVASVLDPLSPFGFRGGRDYEKIENARRLTEREFSYNENLGYISLNFALNADEVLAVAYEYTVGGRTFRVGELSTAGVPAPDALIVKLLKGTNLTPRLPNWDLMMKNIYAIGAFQVNREDFMLNVLYQDDLTGSALNYITEGAIQNQILLRVMNLDNLNSQSEPQPDGMFDFIEGITINSANGRIIFPVREPFGQHLRNMINDDAIAEKYVFEELYDSTQTRARQIAEKNKFKIAGTYKSASSSEIMLNAMNVPQGSVVVTAGGIQLTENVDYTVDYTLGRVRIINSGLMESGTPIRVSLESQSLFNIQTKTLIGTHMNYRFSDDFNIGATVLNLSERPLTQKVNIGDEAISNTIWGINGAYRTNSQFLTTLVDKIPFIETKETSTITVEGEFAHLIPGSARAIGREGVSYIDDFEGSQTYIELKSFPAWSFASVPQGQPDLFPEGELFNNLAAGYNRAKLAWYVIDPLFLRSSSLTPSHLSADDKSSHFVREIHEREIFPFRTPPHNQVTTIPVLNLAFYPDEKGPYNYDAQPNQYSSGIDENRRLNNPESRWGGIMRALQTSDFEAANIEYIEFWLMDPFVEDSMHNGGYLFFNLGDVSEDVLLDGRKSFENGLPIPSEPFLVDTTAWGIVPIKQSMVNAFDNDPSAREAQDVGLNGLNDAQEREFFADYLQAIADLYGVDSEAYNLAQSDPSSDNYHYFRGSNYDAMELGILERYKNYNNPQGNSPTSEQSPESYPTSASTLPNTEDINRDNTLNEAENYYQYRVRLSPDDMIVGQNYITDRVTANAKFENGENSSVNWYQFKIPVGDYERAVGSIDDFKSIRFMRMFLQGFEREVVLRFATLQLVRGEWRKYNFSMLQGGEGLAEEDPSASFEISAVNIEENARKIPVNYVLPPGISRVIDPSQPQLRELNEQSMLFKVLDLAEGDARAAYKNVHLDVRQYQRLKMEVHGSAIPGEMLRDGDLTVFIRLGTDYKNNYYEYEVPLHLTEPGNYDNNSTADRRLVWPDENQFDIDLELFTSAKLARNDAMRVAGSGISMLTVFPYPDGDNMVYVSGNPNLSNVRTIMIGVRNPKDANNRFENDGLPKSGEIWVNELRLTDFRDRGGWAANARATARLADFGSVSLAGSTMQPGFGSIEKKVNDRSKEELYSYDMSTNLELGKFFPENSGVRVPMYFGYSETFINPEYNPLDPDIPLKTSLDNTPDRHTRDSIKHIAQDYTKRKSLNFTNVGITKTEGRPRVYDVENWAVSYSYSEMEARNINTEYITQKRYRGALTYNFATRPNNITPFSQVQFLNKPSLRLIRDFNFNYFPSNISFRTDLNRQYYETKHRNLSNPNFIIEPTVSKDFYWNRYYDVKFDITRALRLDFSATNIARIDEPEGIVNKDLYKDEYELWRDSIMSNIRSFGRTVNYFHTINVNYNIPINKLPMLDWTSASARYNATYGWDVGLLTADSIELGNRIKNSNTIQLNGQMNMVNLYNKVGFLKKINDKYRPGVRQRQPKEYRTVNFQETYFIFRENTPRSVNHQLKTEDITVKAYDDQNNEIEISYEIVNENRIRVTTAEEYRNVRVVVEGQVEARENPLIFIAENTARLLMGMKNISASYSRSEGTLLPGYMPQTQLMGMENYQDMLAPGWPFILGWQDENFHIHAGERGWLTQDSLLNELFSRTYTENFNIRGTFEPFTGLRLDITADRNFSENRNVRYRYDRNLGAFDFESGMQITGNFSMSFISIGSAFEKISRSNNYESEVFDEFVRNTQIISARRAALRREIDPTYQPGGPMIDYYPEGEGNIILDPETGEPFPIREGFNNGYDVTSQEVLVPAFMAAYGVASPEKVTFETFPTLLQILPNWRLTFDGLSRIDFIQKFMRTVNLNHSYRSTYNVGSYINNTLFDESYRDSYANPNLQDGLSYARDIQHNFISAHEISSVSINEQFSPLIGIDMNWHNSLTTRFEFRKSRTVALSLANNQINELQSEEIIIGAGYRFSEVELIIRTGGGQRAFKSDLNIRADFSIRDNKTILRKIIEDYNQPSAGQKILSIRVSSDYMLSDRFNLRLFFDRMINTPLVTTSYQTANTNVGFSVRFTLVN